MKKIYFVLCLLSVVFTGVRADEGMWMISNIDSTLMLKMKALGLKLDSKQLYNEDKPDIRRAIVMFDNGCTGEFVSANGLLFTNHHCARDRVQKLSSVEKNYMRDGYWAGSPSEELPVKGLTVKLLVKTSNVTPEVKEQLKKNSFRRIMTEMEKQYADSASGYTASLDAYSTGEYFISVYQVFTDVRLVGIPPESIGNFGGEDDNFEWPRQSADFAVFRVYVNKQNTPAPYAESNTPYRPQMFLPVSLRGVADNDFVMSIGFPYSTDRSVSSFQLKEDLDVKNKATSLAKNRYVEVVEREMDNSESVRLKYSSKNFSAGNNASLASGLLRQVELSPVFDLKQRDEAALQQWIMADSARQKKYGNVLATLKKNYALQHDAKYAHAMLTAALFNEATVFGIRARQILTKLEDKQPAELTKAVENFGDWYKGFIVNYDAITDSKIVRAMLKLVRNEVPRQYLPGVYDIIDRQFGGNIDSYVDDMYARTLFTRPEMVARFLKKPKMAYRNDPLYVYGTEVYNKLIELKKLSAPYGAEISKAERLFNEAMRAMKDGEHSYPDANFSMRLTYGTVAGADARDGIAYKSRTTLSGVIEKGDNTRYDYFVWPRLKELYIARDYGRYATDGKMYTCFLSSTDITGGNSGSPVINGRGELVGIAFDGVRESLAGTYIYEPEKNRSINTDIRYVMFIIDKFAQNNYILNELTINN